MGLPITATGQATTDTQFQRCAQFQLPNGSLLEIVEPTPTVLLTYVGPVVCIPVDDLHRARHDLEARATEFISSIFRTAEGLGCFYFRAPDEHVYQLQGPCP